MTRVEVDVFLWEDCTATRIEGTNYLGLKGENGIRGTTLFFQHKAALETLHTALTEMLESWNA